MTIIPSNEGLHASDVIAYVESGGTKTFTVAAESPEVIAARIDSQVFTASSIASVFFISAATFATASLIGYTTKRDLTNMGTFLMVGLVGILIAGVVNIFLASSALAFAISVIGVVVFVGLTAYDTQKLKNDYLTNGEVYGFDSPQKSALFGAFSLYLNFINIFQMLLNLLGVRDE